MHLAIKDIAFILTALRNLLTENDLDAYIVPSGDAHYSEFIADCHQRRAYISGFTGSAGTGIVTLTNASLWTDGRYFLQAEQQLNSSLWTLMRDGQPGVPSQSQWLNENLGDGAKVGVDPTLYSKRQWDSMSEQLKLGNKELVSVPENLVDKIWNDDGRPECSKEPVFNLGLEFTGKPTRNKVAEVRQEMSESTSSVLLVTELDEVAWLLNLRGRDIPFGSTFFAYVVVAPTEFHLFINSNKLPQNETETLKANINEIQIHEYETIFETLPEILNRNTDGKVMFNQNTNYALIRLIQEERQLMKLTPIALMKATKNPTEVIGYKNALVRDSAALCEFFVWLEEEVAKSDANVTEISAAEELHSIRAKREHFFDDSFQAISAAGDNGAIIHYMPTPETNREIRADDMYLLDSGGLYKDGTTDITRTIHLGVPSSHQKDCYTRVLKGQIALARAIFPSRMVGSRLDSFARQFLWEAGLDYNHGTGHGVGSFLNVHEGPFSIGSGHNSLDPGLRANFFTSNEPGYYEDKAFGIRLENIVRVKNVSLEHNFQSRGFLGFEDVTFVPYQHKLIDFSLLTEEEINYLNNYQLTIRKQVGDYMRQNGMSDKAYDWMIRSTIPVDQNGPTISPTQEPIPTTTPSSNPSESDTGSPQPSSTSEPSSANNVKTYFMTFILPVFIFMIKLN